MGELTISDEAVEAAAVAEAMWQGVELSGLLRRHQDVYRAKARRSILAFLQAEGFGVETRVSSTDINSREARLTGRWKPEQGTKPASTDRDVDDSAGAT